MPSHWTYAKAEANENLYQGDIIERTEPLLRVLGSVHKYFCDEKYVAFLVMSQTCDLVLRGSGGCKAKYINLAVVRSLESVMPSLLADLCGTDLPGVFYEEARGDAKQLLERIVNQNEQSLGLFYLEPDADVKIPVPSVALLRVSISLKSRDHYSLLQAARVGRLDPPFRNKLGWLTGNLYSRVDTPDWPETIGKKQAIKKIDNLFKDFDESFGSIWAPKPLLQAALAQCTDLASLPKEKILPTIRSYEPNPPEAEAIARLEMISAHLLESVTPPQIQKHAELLKNDKGYSVLVAEMILSVARLHLGNLPSLTELFFRLTDDSQIRLSISSWMSRLSDDFMRARTPKTLNSFMSMFSCFPCVDHEMRERIRDLVTSSLHGAAPEHFSTFFDALLKTVPTPPMNDRTSESLRAIACETLTNRLAARLKSDAGFKGAFQTRR